jgi:hypothetical protein
MCPMRIVPIYGTVSLGCLFLFIKLFYNLEILRLLCSMAFLTLFSQFIAFGITVLSIASYRKTVLLYDQFSELQNLQKTVIGMRGGRRLILLHKDKMRRESFTLLAMMGSILVILAIVRILNVTYVHGIAR